MEEMTELEKLAERLKSHFVNCSAEMYGTLEKFYTAHLSKLQELTEENMALVKEIEELKNAAEEADREARASRD